METEAFRAGVDRLLELARARRTAMMCAEAVWWRCHRGLVADYLKSRGLTVTHILGPAKAEPHPYTSAARIESGALTYRAGAGRPAREGGEPEQGTLPLHEGEG
jgi:uncharacterized protein (DUF488 family)